MDHHRIVVGVDGSPASRAALEWAARQAASLHATVLVVTAWRVPTEGGPAERGWLVDQRRRLTDMQHECIAAVREAVGPDELPVIGRELILADPVVALRHAGRMADLVVIGGSQAARPTSVALRLAFTATPGTVPLVVIAPSRQPSAPEPVAVAA
jgi:nucleotide-binding universal stress UspA family protein